MTEDRYIYAEDKREVVYTDIEKELFDKYLSKWIKNKLISLNEELNIENARRINWYELLEEFLPGIIFCTVKKENENEMSLFAMDNPTLETYGLKYAGDKNIDLFWESIENALSMFESKDFFTCIYKESSTKKSRTNRDPVWFEKDEDGYVISVLRDGTKGRTCLLVEKNYDTYDRITSPDSLLGDCIRAKIVGNLRGWTIKMLEKFGF